MKYLVSCIFVVLFSSLSVLNATDYDRTAFHVADFSLAQFLMETHSLTAENPQRSMECFDKYGPKIQEIHENYKKGYENCLNKAAEESAAVDELPEEDRKEVEDKAQKTCDRLTICNNEQLAIPFYKCYEDAGGKNIQELYSLSADASEIVDDKNEQLRQIESNKNICIKANQRKYDEDLGKVRSDLSKCLQGNDPEPTTTPEPEPTTTTPEPEPESTTTTSEPEPEPTTTTLEPEPEPTTTTLEPEPEPTTTTLEPEPEPTTTTLEPEPEPTTTTLEPEPEPTTTTLEPETTTPDSSELLPEEDLSMFVKKHFAEKVKNYRKHSRV